MKRSGPPGGGLCVTTTLVAAALAAVLLGGLHPASAQGAPEPTAPRLVLERQSPWVTEGGPFALEVRVAGATDGGETVTATVHAAVTSRADIADDAAGEALGGTLASAGPLPVGADPSGTPAGRQADDAESARFEFATDGSDAAVSAGVVPAPIDAAGIYPVEVRLATEDGVELDRIVTHLIRLPGDPAAVEPLDLALVMPVDAGPGIGPGGGRRVDRAATDRFDTLVDALIGQPRVPVVVVPTPDTVETIADGPRLRRLRRAVDGRQVLSSPYVPIDTAAWVAAGLDDDLASEVTTGDAVLAEHLVDRPDRRTAVTADTLTPQALTRLRELGTDQVVVPESALAPREDASLTLARPFVVPDSAGGLQRAVAADAGLEAHLDRTGDPVLDASTLLADLAAIYFEQPAEERGVTLTLPRTWEPSSEFLDTLLEALAAPSVVRAVTLDDLFEGLPDATAADGTTLVRPLDPAPSAPLGGYPDARRLTRLTTQGFISLAGEDNPLVASLQRRLAVSGSADFDRAQRQAYLVAIAGAIDSATASVRAPETGTVTLTSRDGRIPLNLSNENLYDVTVRLVLESERLEFPEGEQVVVDLPRSSVTALEIEVRSRTSGTFPLRISMTSPDEVLAVAETRFEVRSTVVSNVGLVLSVGAGAFLALWWLSHFRRVRRARSLIDTEAGADPSSADVEPPASATEK